MGIQETVERTYHVIAVCDNCGAERKWDQPVNPNGGEDLSLGFWMLHPTDWDKRDSLWFHESACVHAYIESNVIEAVRHPEGVKP